MAGLEVLTAMIYHERQQEGSMLCAQHALNSLLQGNYFTAPDLASIANSFDTLEHDALEPGTERASSHNMDDTGFFSVQVMDKALDVWGLHLVRWRSEQMRPYQAEPHKQLAFVLNLQQHWFTLRRFGPAHASPDNDPGEGHWFNLNSQYTAPKWVSRTYLDMFLRQSEQEGYSVFAVIQADPSKPLALPRTEADQAAATLSGPDSAPGHSSAMPGAFLDTQGGTSEVVIPDAAEYDVNNEDVELQAALAASLTGAEYSFGQHAYVPQAPVPAPPLRRAPEPPASLLRDENEDDVMEVDSTGTPVDAAANVDPVAASMARNREVLERMRRMQEAALREAYEDETTGMQRPDVQRRRTREQEEQEELERAIAASVAENNSRSGVSTPGDAVLVQDEDDEDEEWTPEGDKENTPTRAPRRSTRVSSDRLVGQSSTLLNPSEMQVGEEVHRVYDDEDEQLQAALRASLETMPEGYVLPPSPPPPQRPSSSAHLNSTPAPAPGVTSSTIEAVAMAATSPSKSTKDDKEGDVEDTEDAPPSEKIDIEEMRRRRLARFGG